MWQKKNFTSNLILLLFKKKMCIRNLCVLKIHIYFYVYEKSSYLIALGYLHSSLFHQGQILLSYFHFMFKNICTFIMSC